MTARAARRQPLRRPSRKPRIPRGPARRVGSPQPPRAVEHFLAMALRRVVATVSRAIARVIVPQLADFAKPDEEDPKRLDAPPPPPADGSVGAVIKAATKAAHDALEQAEKDVERASETAAKRTVRHSQSEFRRIGINVKREPKLAILISEWTRTNVARIKGMTDDQIGKIAKLLDEDGLTMRHETLAKEIARQLEDVSDSRAEFIARDQVLTLNAQVTGSRQQAAGITKYVWTSSQDERVRPEHERLEGQTFSWESGGDPEEGHPGDAPLCRCVAFPLLDDLDGDD